MFLDFVAKTNGCVPCFVPPLTVNNHVFLLVKGVVLFFSNCLKVLRECGCI